VLQRVDHADRKVDVSVTKSQIKSPPDFDESQIDQLDEYDTYYGTPRWMVRRRKDSTCHLNHQFTVGAQCAPSP